MTTLRLDSYGRADPPRPRPRSITVGQVHLGLGAFHRAHQAVYTEDAMRATGETHWGIAGFTQRSATSAARLSPQDGLYTVVERGVGAAAPRIVGALREVHDASAQPAAVVDRIADPAVTVVTLTVTEKGYRQHPATGTLNRTDPAVAADLASPTPRTVPAVLAHAIARRVATGAAPLTVLSCDNLPGNGRLLHRLVTEFADAVGLDVAGGAVFPCTVVDRIVPATTEHDIAALAYQLRVRDAAPVVCEPFRQWIIENSFAGPIPAWTVAGAQLTDDIAPFEQLKLRMLNAAHTTLAYLGLKLGYSAISEAVRDPVLDEICRRLFAEDVIPSLDAPEGVDATQYGASVLTRFANPALPHTTIQVGADGSQKIGPRLLSTVAARAEAGAEAPWASAGIAGWALHVVDPVDANGRPVALSDPRGDELRTKVAGLPVGAAVRRLVTDPAIVGESIAGDTRFASRVSTLAADLHRHGAPALMAAVRS